MTIKTFELWRDGPLLPGHVIGTESPLATAPPGTKMVTSSSPVWVDPGGTAQIEVSPDGVTWSTVPVLGPGYLFISATAYVRAAGGTSPTYAPMERQGLDVSGDEAKWVFPGSPAPAGFFFRYENGGGLPVEGISYVDSESITEPDWDQGWSMLRVDPGEISFPLTIQSIVKPEPNRIYFNLVEGEVEVGDHVIISRVDPFPGANPNSVDSYEMGDYSG